MRSNVEKTSEIALIEANCEPIDGWQIYWILSKTQIEYMLTDIATLPLNHNQTGLLKAQYQDEVLYVLNLESYYGLSALSSSTSDRYLVTKYPASDNRLIRAILKLSNPVRLRKIDTDTQNSEVAILKSNADQILGAFELQEKQIGIIPDIEAILTSYSS